LLAYGETSKTTGTSFEISMAPMNKSHLYGISVEEMKKRAKCKLYKIKDTLTLKFIWNFAAKTSGFVEEFQFSFYYF
jgi:hypothetical protein